MKDSFHRMENLKLTLKMFDYIKESSGYNHIEEPVSPPACDPGQGPPLIFSQSIEDIASEVVDENRKSKKTEQIQIQKDKIHCNISKDVKLSERNSCSFLFPATISEISEDPKSSPTLHMSGGMVSTDVTLHMASVPTSVITHNTCTEKRPETDEEIDNIFEYFMCGTGDNVRLQREPESQMNSTMKEHSIRAHEMCLDLPLDLSVPKIQVENNRKRQREKTAEEQESSITKRCFNEEMEETKRLQQECVTKEEDPGRRQTLRNVEVVDKSAMNIEETPTNKEKLAVENTEGGNTVACRLVLPKRKLEKARLIFTSGMYVEIDREMFKTFEQHIAKETKLERHKTPQKTGKTVKHASKAELRRKKLKKEDSIGQPEKSTAHAEGDPSDCVENYDITMKDMQMIITNGDEENQGASKRDEKQINQNQINGSNMTPPPTPPPSISTNILLPNSTSLNNSFLLSPTSSPPPSTLNCPSPPPSAPCSLPGLHKLPSIVSKPSYYAKFEGRTVVRAK